MTQSILQAVFGIIVFILFSWLISENRRGINYKQVFSNLLFQGLAAVVLLHIPFARKLIGFLSDGVIALKSSTLEGTKFVFGYLGGGKLPFDPKGTTFIFAFQTLPMVIVISALSMLLFHLRILPVLVKGISWVMKKTMGIGGALGVCSAAKIFLGQTEAPLLIKPYLKNMSRGELFTIMCMGFATTSLIIIGLYAMILDTVVPYATVHLLTASIISVLGAITLSRVVVPHEKSSTEGKMVLPYEFSGSMDAIAKGTSDGIKLFFNIIAMLIVFVSLVSLSNRLLGLFPNFMGEAITLQRCLGVFMSPVAWFMGIPWQEASSAGSLLGIKTVLNEFYAFTELSGMASALSVHSRTVMTYALCGFANVSSMGIMIGGLSSMVPERRADVLSLSFKALIVGTLSSCLSGTIVGILLWPCL